MIQARVLRTNKGREAAFVSEFLSRSDETEGLVYIKSGCLLRTGLKILFIIRKPDCISSTGGRPAPQINVVPNSGCASWEQGGSVVFGVQSYNLTR